MWNISEITYDRDTLENAIADEKKSTWNGKIALLTASEYVRANTNTSSCGTLANLKSNYSTCKSTNYLVKSSYWWLFLNLSSNQYNTFFSGSYLGVIVRMQTLWCCSLCFGLIYSGERTSASPFEISGGSCSS